MNKMLTRTLLAISLFAGTAGQAAVIVVNTPGVTLSAGQPIQAVFTDANGNTYQQQVYYNPSAGGIDVGNSGNYASVYFPILGTGYLAYNGFWVGQDGYYWNNGAHVYVGPHWNGYWNDHWHGGGWHGNDWHGGGHEGWHGGGDWHGGGHEGWHGGGGGHRR